MEDAVETVEEAVGVTADEDEGYENFDDALDAILGS